MNTLDILLAIPLGIGCIQGFMRGFLTEVVRLLVVLIGCFASYSYATPCAIWINEYTNLNIWLCKTITVILLFLITATILSFIAKMILKLIKAIHLDLLNKLLGALLATCKWTLLLTLIILCAQYIDNYYPFINTQLTQNSLLYTFFTEVGGYMEVLIDHILTSSH